MMMKRVSRLVAVAILAGAAAAAAGNITVQNLSSVTVPETRVYKTCWCACSKQVFGSLAPGFSSTQTRTSFVNSCVWAEEIDPDMLYPSCSRRTDSLPDPTDPAQITVTWTGTTSANLACSITVS
jgi:hypothetical protein